MFFRGVDLSFHFDVIKNELFKMMRLVCGPKSTNFYVLFWTATT